MTPEDKKWAIAINKLIAYGKRGNPEALVKKLRSDDPITPEVRELLARTVQLMHPPSVPRSRDWGMLAAAEEYRERKHELPKGKARETAETALLAEIARKYDVVTKKNRDETNDKDIEDARALRAFAVRQNGGTWKRLRFTWGILGKDLG